MSLSRPLHYEYIMWYSYNRSERYTKTIIIMSPFCFRFMCPTRTALVSISGQRIVSPFYFFSRRLFFFYHAHVSFTFVVFFFFFFHFTGKISFIFIVPFVACTRKQYTRACRYCAQTYIYAHIIRNGVGAPL